MLAVLVYIHAHGIPPVIYYQIQTQTYLHVYIYISLIMMDNSKQHEQNAQTRNK